MSRGLVLSLFPGFGLLDRAFEEAGFAVARGLAALWGGDARVPRRGRRVRRGHRRSRVPGVLGGAAGAGPGDEAGGGPDGKRGARRAAGNRGYLRGDLPISKYGRLQGFPELGEALAERGCGRLFTTLLLGNGVPRAMRLYVAGAVVG